MPQVRLCDADQQRFGCPEWMDLDLRAISVADLEELSERFGFDPDDWPEPFVGQLTLEQSGDPDAKPKAPPWRNRAIAWIGLRQNGFPITWEQAGEARVLLARFRNDPDAERGKGDMPETASPPSEPSTIPPSDTSTD